MSSGFCPKEVAPEVNCPAGAGVGDPLRRADIPQPPPGHGKAFRESVHRDGSVLHFIESANACVITGEVDVFIDLIGNDIDAFMSSDHLGDGVEFFLKIDRPGRVTGGEQQHSGPGVIAAATCSAVAL